jgi:hypothetical protein
VAWLWNHFGRGKMGRLRYPSEGRRSEIPNRKIAPIMNL